MPATEFPYGYGMPAPVTWPGFAETWLRGEYEYPAGRGTRPGSNIGWTCPGCGRGWAPGVRQCGRCGPEKPRSEGCQPPREGGMCGCGEPDPL